MFIPGFAALLAMLSATPVYGQPSAVLWRDQLFVAANPPWAPAALYRGKFDPKANRIRDPIEYINPGRRALGLSQAKLSIRDDRVQLGEYIFGLGDIPLLESSEFGSGLLEAHGYGDIVGYLGLLDAHHVYPFELFFPDHRKHDVPVQRTGGDGWLPWKDHIRTAGWDIQIDIRPTVRLFHAHEGKLFVSVEPDYASRNKDGKTKEPPDRELRTGMLPAEFAGRFAAYTVNWRDYLVTTEGQVFLVVPKGKDGVEVSAVWNDPKQRIVGVVQDLENGAVIGWGFVTDYRSPERFYVCFEAKPEAVRYKPTVPLLYKFTLPLPDDGSDAYIESYECARAFRAAAEKK